MTSFHPSRLLLPDAPRKKYIRSVEGGADKLSLDVLKGLHFGQRKLLLSEIEFFTTCLSQLPVLEDSRVIVVYAGAANGSHLPELFLMFPKLKFILIDPAPFCNAVQELYRKNGDGPVLEIIQECCTPELCGSIRERYMSTVSAEGPRTHLLLVSDIRSGSPSKMSNKEATQMIMRDNQLQRDFSATLQPLVGMFKFHPPYPRCREEASIHFDPTDDTPDAIEYYDGALLLGVWAPKSSSEVRLVVNQPGNTDAPMRQYDCTAFEEMCYHYNTTGRYARDVAAEVRILTDYITFVHRSTAGGSEAQALPREIIALSAHISETLGFPKFTPIEGYFFAQHAEPDDADERSIIFEGSVVHRFSEDDARLCALLYDADAAHRFTWAWRELISAERVRAVLQATQRHPISIPADQPQAGGFPREFWFLASFKRLGAFYGVHQSQRPQTGAYSQRGRGRGRGRGGGFASARGTMQQESAAEDAPVLPLKAARSQ